MHFCYHVLSAGKKKRRKKKNKKIIIILFGENSGKMNAKKPTVHLTVSVPDIKKLRNIRDKMSSTALNRFEGRYGDILDLLKVKVQEEAITALIHFMIRHLDVSLFRIFSWLLLWRRWMLCLGFQG